MSRTDNHRPYRARILDKGSAVATHDHRSGECDLPDLDDWVHERVTERTHCGWEIPLSVLSEHPTCGCDMCTGSQYRKRERRRRRHNERRDIENRLREYQDDLSATGVWLAEDD